jgi:hypothetical protein
MYNNVFVCTVKESHVTASVIIQQVLQRVSTPGRSEAEEKTVAAQD